MLHASVARLSNLSANIRDEIVEQNTMLDDIDKEVIRADASIQQAAARTKTLARRANSNAWCYALICIVAVIGTVIIFTLVY